jgi:hypothetical protein
MAISKKHLAGIILAVLVIILAGWLVWIRAAKQESATTTDTTSSTLETDKEAAKELSQSQTLAGKQMEGILKASDNSKKGNLMLVTASSTLYISSSRDFSNLLGKEVKVTYDGTTDDFRLGDIIAK